MTGYRYSIDPDGNVYIIELSYSEDKEKPDHFLAKNNLPEIWFHCADCICLSIKNANTGEEKEEISLYGMHHNYVTYKKNCIIPGETWYVHDFFDLFREDECSINLLLKAKDGTIYKGRPGYKVLEKMVTDLCSCSVSELAEEMQISEEDLQRMFEWLKEGHSDEKRIAQPIIDAGNAIYKRKLESGKIEPEWKKYLRDRGVQT